MKRVLISPLDWGLGHTTRIVPIIEILLGLGWQVHIVADDKGIAYLQPLFPKAQFHAIPPYRISLSASGKNFLSFLLLQSPHIKKTFRLEKAWIRQKASELDLQLIISDNRPGLFVKGIHSVFITHQVHVYLQNKVLSNVSTFFHKSIMANFDRVWIPDMEENGGLAGNLSHSRLAVSNRFIGILSRMQPMDNAVRDLDFFIMISGPDPARKAIEEKMIKAINQTSFKILFFRGSVKPPAAEITNPHCEVKNIGNSADVAAAISRAKNIIVTSGYSTIMDLAKLGRSAWIVPTPGQPEQQYLGKFLSQQKLYRHMPADKIELLANDFTAEEKNLRALKSNYDLKEIIREEIRQL